MNRRWPKGRLKCEACHRMRNFVRVPGRTSYACPRCRHQVYPLVDTIFERSTTSLTLWFEAARLYISDDSIKATDIQRKLGVTYKTAWRLRNALHCLNDLAFLNLTHDLGSDVRINKLIIDTVVRRAQAFPKTVPDRKRLMLNASRKLEERR